MRLMIPEASKTAGLSNLVIPQRVSKKRHIYDSLLGRIQDQSLPVGTKLPSATVLASEWQVAYATVHTALNDLTRDGWLVRSPKQGTFVSTPRENLSERLLKTATVVLPPRDGIVASGNGDEVFDMLQGLTEGARTVNWEIRIESIPSTLSKQERQQICKSLKNTSCTIFIGNQYRVLIQELSQQHSPTITLWSDTGYGNSVIYDRPAGVRLAMDHLLGRGRRKIGYFGNTLEAGPNSKFNAYQEVMKENGLEVKEAWIGHCASHQKALGLIQEFFQMQPDCDAIFVANYRFACALAQEARACGIRIPDDLAIVANGIEGSHIDDLPLTYTRIPFFEFGTMAMKWLSTKLETAPENHREIITLNAELISRASS